MRCVWDFMFANITISHILTIHKRTHFQIQSCAPAKLVSHVLTNRSRICKQSDAAQHHMAGLSIKNEGMPSVLWVYHVRRCTTLCVWWGEQYYENCVELHINRQVHTHTHSHTSHKLHLLLLVCMNTKICTLHHIPMSCFLSFSCLTKACWAHCYCQLCSIKSVLFL